MQLQANQKQAVLCMPPERRFRADSGSGNRPPLSTTYPSETTPHHVSLMLSVGRMQAHLVEPAKVQRVQAVRPRHQCGLCGLFWRLGVNLDVFSSSV